MTLNRNNRKESRMMMIRYAVLLGLTLFGTACDGEKDKILQQERAELLKLHKENETLKEDKKTLTETLSEKEKVIEQQIQEILSLKREVADKEAAEKKTEEQGTEEKKEDDKTQEILKKSGL